MFGNNSADDGSSGIAIATKDGRVWTFGNPSQDDIEQAKELARKQMDTKTAVKQTLIGGAIGFAVVLGTKKALEMVSGDDEDDE